MLDPSRYRDGQFLNRGLAQLRVTKGQPDTRPSRRGDNSGSGGGNKVRVWFSESGHARNIEQEGNIRKEAFPTIGRQTDRF